MFSSLQESLTPKTNIHYYAHKKVLWTTNTIATFTIQWSLQISFLQYFAFPKKVFWLQRFWIWGVSDNMNFLRLTGVCLDGTLSLPKDVLLLVTFLCSSPKNDAVLEWSLKINKAEAEFKDQNAAAVCLLPLLASYFQENLGELFQLHQVGAFIITRLFVSKDTSSWPCWK